MHPEPQGLFTGAELWVQPADAHGDQDIEASKGFDEVALGYGTSDASRNFSSPTRKGRPRRTERRTLTRRMLRVRP